MKYLYKYPQRKYPYEQLVQESVSCNRDVVEFELLDTGIFDDDRYWDVFIEVSRSALQRCMCSLTRWFLVRERRG